MADQRSINQKSYTSDTLKHRDVCLAPKVFLAYRDLPELIDRHLNHVTVRSTVNILDYGCGPGTSTAVLKEIFERRHQQTDLIGMDINEENLAVARKDIPEATFLPVTQEQVAAYQAKFDLLVCNFVLLENNPDQLLNTLQSICTMMHQESTLIITNASENAYDQKRNWLRINNQFEENVPPIKDGQTVKLCYRDLETRQQFVFTDYFYSKNYYLWAFNEVGLTVVDSIDPLGRAEDGIPWKDETRFSPLRIFVTKLAR